MKTQEPQRIYNENNKCTHPILVGLRKQQAAICRLRKTNVKAKNIAFLVSTIMVVVPAGLVKNCALAGAPRVAELIIATRSLKVSCVRFENKGLHCDKQLQTRKLTVNYVSQFHCCEYLLVKRCTACTAIPCLSTPPIQNICSTNFLNSNHILCNQPQALHNQLF